MECVGVSYRSDDSRAVGSDQSGLILSLEHVRNTDHVVLWDTLCNADNKWHLSLQSLLNTSGSEWRWDEDGRGICASCFSCLLNIGKHGLSKMLRASFLWVGASDDVGTILDGALCVEGTLLASEALE